MTKVPITNNIKGNIGEALVLGKQTLPEPLSEELVEFLSGLYEFGERPNIYIKAYRGETFHATDEYGEQRKWVADGKVTVSWASAKKQEMYDGEFLRTDMEAIFPVEVKTGEYAKLERDQLDVARVIASTPNHIYPTIFKVSIEDLPESFDVDVRIFGRDFD